MRSFKLYPSDNPDDKRHYLVTVCDKPEQVRAYWEKFYPAEKSIVAMFTAKDKSGDRLGNIVFCRLRVDVGTSTHELLHAACHYVRFVCRKALKTPRNEELLAYCLESLVTQFWEKY